MANIEALVGRQTALWELRRRLEVERSEPPGPGPKDEPYRPCLLVSRECGGGGTSMARLVCERLRWQIFDREIVDEVARSAQVRRQLIDSVDERVRSGWREFFRVLADGEGIGRESYLFHLRQVILSLGHHGGVIIVGRGANYILPPECTVRVRLVAPLEVRCRHMAELKSISLNKARRHVEQIDAERAAFVREAFGRDVNAPEDYDLVLNTGVISLPEAAEITLAKLQAKLQVQPETAPCTK
jgi:hypothetical protein